MRLLTRPIAATLLLFVGGCAGAPEPAPKAAPGVDSAADAPVDPAADLQAPPVADRPANPPAPATEPTCDDWAEWDFFESASAELVWACLQAGTNVNAVVEDGHTILHRAAMWADGEVTALLLQAGADVNARDDEGETPLHLAAENDNLDAVTILLEAGADVNLANATGDTPLLWAMGSPVSGGTRARLLSKLLALGADPNARGDRGVTPLYEAVTAVADGPKVIRALLAAGADPRALTDYGESALHAAARRPLRHTPEVIALLAEIGLDVNARNETGQTPLHIARIYDNLAAVRTLLELGADPNAQDEAGRIADPVCHWSGWGDPIRGWDFLAESPAESVRGCLESGTPVDARHEQGATPLALMISTLACCADFENVLREFVAAGADVNARDEEGRTPLHRALYRLDHPPNIVTSALLEAGADPGARDSVGSTPMHIAARSGRGPEASILAAAGADVNSRSKNGQTPLHVARDPATIRTLLQLGADPAARDGAGTTANPAACARWGSEAFFAFATADIVAGCIADGADALTIAHGSGATALFTAAASTPDPAIVSMLLEAGADVHARDGFLQYTPLHNAARSGTPQVVRALLEAGADVDAWAKGFGVDWGWGWTPLHLAARSNPDPEVVSALVEAGADLQAPGEESYYRGNTPLHYAGDNPNPDVASALLSAGAEVNALSATGRTPLHEAAANASNPAVIGVLVAAGADVNARDSRGYAPLHSAAWYNPRPEVATALLAAGADVNARDPDGYVPPGRAATDRTPLFMALYRGDLHKGGQPMPTGRSLAVVEVLVRAGASLEQADESGLTALHAAAIWTPAAFPLLLRLGADPNARDANGRTPWDYALRHPSLQGLEEVRRMREEMRRVRLPNERSPNAQRPSGKEMPATSFAPRCLLLTSVSSNASLSPSVYRTSSEYGMPPPPVTPAPAVRPKPAAAASTMVPSSVSSPQSHERDTVESTQTVQLRLNAIAGPTNNRSGPLPGRAVSSTESSALSVLNPLEPSSSNTALNPFCE